MGILSLNYRRPEYVDKQQFRKSDSSFDTNDEKSDASLRSGRSGTSAGIPDALTFDKIISGGTCPPCTIRDFMNYLIYIEHSAENLQFFLWYRDYVKRFSEVNSSDIHLAQEWTQAMEDETLAKIQKEAADNMKKESKAADIFKGSDFEKSRGDVMVSEIRDPFATPPPTPGSEDTPSIYSGSQASSYRSQAQDAFAAAGVKQPFTIQPFRGEINRVIATYIVDGSPRQLNLSGREQKSVVQALAYTTHPTALRAVAAGVENTLRRQAHPNFIRWSICNGNPARGAFARQLGVAVTALSTLGAVLLTLSSAARGFRALFAVGWVLGLATLITARKGMCVVLHGLHHRQVRPWELFLDADADAGAEEEEQGGEGGGEKRSFDSFGSANSYEDQPWVVKYERRNLVRKVFDREVWIREPALRQIQDTIALQSLLCAILGAAVLTAVFVAVPSGRFF
ncbi:hypothetical protein F4779DRAFT_637232 [Xylariaceae sp. FL0662B]|nr:hypothetical protein F4779DRAFT_637232 [Xylariaceae sp. FL0662B]